MNFSFFPFYVLICQGVFSSTLVQRAGPSQPSAAGARVSSRGPVTTHPFALFLQIRPTTWATVPCTRVSYKQSASAVSCQTRGSLLGLPPQHGMKIYPWCRVPQSRLQPGPVRRAPSLCRPLSLVLDTPGDTRAVSLGPSRVGPVRILQDASRPGVWPGPGTSGWTLEASTNRSGLCFPLDRKGRKNSFDRRKYSLTCVTCASLGPGRQKSNVKLDVGTLLSTRGALTRTAAKKWTAVSPFFALRACLQKLLKPNARTPSVSANAGESGRPKARSQNAEPPAWNPLRPVEPRALPRRGPGALSTRSASDRARF